MASATGKAVPPPYPPGLLVGESSLGRASFLGARLPPEVEAMARSTRELSKDTFRNLLKVTVNALDGKDCKESVKLIAESANLSDEQLAVLISGMYTLLREALRLPSSTLKQDVFKEDLRELRIPEDFVADFATVAFGNRRPTLKATIQKQGNKLPRIEDFKWRVDVAISTRLSQLEVTQGGLSFPLSQPSLPPLGTCIWQPSLLRNTERGEWPSSSLARALQPSILMQMKLSDGSAHQFEGNSAAESGSGVDESFLVPVLSRSGGLIGRENLELLGGSKKRRRSWAFKELENVGGFIFF